MALTVEVVFPPRAKSLRLPDGASIADAVAASGLVHGTLEALGLKAGIFGRVAAPGTRLSDGDRVEIYRPLVLDPKEARRRRAASSRGKRARV